MKLRNTLVVCVVGIVGTGFCLWNLRDKPGTAVDSTVLGTAAASARAGLEAPVSNSEAEIKAVNELRNQVAKTRMEKVMLEAQIAGLSAKQEDSGAKQVEPKKEGAAELAKTKRFLQDKKGPAARQAYLQRSFAREKATNFDLAEVLNITQEDADLIHQAVAEHHLQADGMDYDDREAVKKWKEEGKAVLVGILGEDLYAKYREYFHDYKKRDELLIIRESMAEKGVVIAHEPARAFLKVVMQEFEESANLWKFEEIKSDQQFNAIVARQVAYNNRLISKAPGILHPDQVNALSVVLKERLQTEYLEALEYLRKGSEWTPGSGIAPLTQ